MSADGYVAVFYIGNQNSYLNIDTQCVSFGFNCSYTDNYIKYFIPVVKGETFIAYHGNYKQLKYFRFYYSEGSPST